MAPRPNVVRTALPALLAILLVAGCLGGPRDDGPSVDATDVTLIVDFEGFDGDSFPGRLAEWDMDADTGRWVRVDEQRSEGAYYIVRDLTASDALDALRSMTEATGVPFGHHTESQGAFVDSIDGVANGKDGHYWSYYINGEYGLVSADTAGLDDGDTVRWVYMGNPFG